MLHKVLFETRVGEWLLRQLERHAGLAVVQAECLDDQTASPAQAMESHTGPVDARETHAQEYLTTEQVT